MEPNAAFAVSEHPTEKTKRLLSISVVFSDERSAISFIVSVDKYIATTRGVAYHGDSKFTKKRAEQPNQDRFVLESDYVPNQADGEPPKDSPVWEVDLSATDISSLSPTTIYSTSRTVFKYQRIEADTAFARNAPEGAHIFPRAKCKGPYEWLDKADFNRLALSHEGHSNFDDSTNGQKVRAATCSAPPPRCCASGCMSRLSAQRPSPDARPIGIDSPCGSGNFGEYMNDIGLKLDTVLKPEFRFVGLLDGTRIERVRCGLGPESLTLGSTYAR